MSNPIADAGRDAGHQAAHGAEDGAEAEDAVRAAEERRWAAQLESDRGALEELLADELQYTHSNGVVDTKRSYVDNIANEVLDYRSAERSDVALQVIGDVAMFTGRVVMHVVANRSRDVHLDTRYSAIWVNRDGAWRFLCWQSTPIPAAS